MSAIMDPLLLRIVELEEERHIILLVEIGKGTEARVRGKHFEEYVPRIHVFRYVCYGLVLVARYVQAGRSACLWVPALEVW